MARRSADWNIGLNRDLKDPKFVEQFIRGALDEGSSLQEVMGKLIRAYGVKELAAKVKMPSSNILRTINSKHNPTVDTITRLLKPFGLTITVTTMQKKCAA